MTYINQWYNKRNERNAQFKNSIRDTSLALENIPSENSTNNMDTIGLIKSDEVINGVINYDEVDRKAKTLEKTRSIEASKPALKPKLEDTKSLPNQITPSNDIDGKYLVIAGSYLLKENAMKMVKKLNNKGYKASTVIFQSSEYHSVIAGTHSTRADAEKVVNNLKASGIDSFIKVKS